MPETMKRQPARRAARPRKPQPQRIEVSAYLRERIEKAAAARRAWMIEPAGSPRTEQLREAYLNAACRVCDLVGSALFGDALWDKMDGSVEFDAMRAAEKAAEAQQAMPA